MDAEIPVKYVVQLSWHKNLKSLDAYKAVSTVHQQYLFFNTYFSNVGSNLSDEIPSSADSNPEDYLDQLMEHFPYNFHQLIQ